MILFKPSKIVVDCFTAIPDLPNLFPITPAKEELPDYWKNLETTVTNQGIVKSTMRLCPGVQYLHTQGFIIKNWADVTINTQNNRLSWEPNQLADSHESYAWGDRILKEYYHFKILSPWAFKEKTGVKFLMTNTFWHDTSFKPFIPNGLIEWKYQHFTNIHMFIPKLNTAHKNIIIPAGKPLVQVFPLSDKVIETKMHVVTDNELKSMFEPFRFTKVGWYFKRKKLLNKK
jgi:hypothetical protein